MKCFPVNFAKFLRTPLLTEHLWWLLLNPYSSKSNYGTKIGIKSQTLCHVAATGSLCSSNQVPHNGFDKKYFVESNQLQKQSPEVF